ncbi:MAG TPA: DNA methyltransferase, partial [bacterium]|nr:DNA methyltransferase [bacterium]HQP99582.1 DNA methyltransferase [bacterium]
MSRKQNNNKIAPEDRPIHDWYRFVLSYPPHLVREYLEKFGIRPGQRVLDPFCGTGTTLVECKKLGIPCIGVEANPIAHFASQVKTDWSPDPECLLNHASRVAESAYAKLSRQGIRDILLPDFDDQADTDHALVDLRTLDAATHKLLLADSISPLPLHKVFVLLEQLERHQDSRYTSHERLALAKALVCSIGNLEFGPEVGVGPPKENAPVVAAWLEAVRIMAEDLRHIGRKKETNAQVYLGDARELTGQLDQDSIDAVITSPPYPNEKDYTRTTRLESVLLGFINSKEDLRHLKRHLVRSNTRGVYKDDDDDVWISDHPEIQRIAQ